MNISFVNTARNVINFQAEFFAANCFTSPRLSLGASSCNSL